MFPSIIKPDAPRAYFGERNDTFGSGGGMPVYGSDNSYHTQKYNDRVKSVRDSIKDDTSNKKKYVRGYYRGIVSSNGKALGSGNTLFFINRDNSKERLTGGVLHTQAGVEYAKNILERRSQQLRDLEELNIDGAQPSASYTTQPIPMSDDDTKK